MLGWITLIILIAAAVGIWRYFFDGWNDGFVMEFFMWAVTTAVATFFIVLTFAGVSSMLAWELKDTDEYRYELRALNSDSNVSGRSYFLGGGYIDEERVLNHIVRNADGSSQLGYTDADESKIYEDSTDKPYMITIERHYGNWWVLGDEPYRTTYEYHYHIPAGSVLESTQITND